MCIIKPLTSCITANPADAKEKLNFSFFLNILLSVKKCDLKKKKNFVYPNWKTHFHQASLHITSFCSFDGCVNQSFSSTHCVKEKFSWSQTRIKTIFHKSSCCWIFSWKKNKKSVCSYWWKEINKTNVQGDAEKFLVDSLSKI